MWCKTPSPFPPSISIENEHPATLAEHLILHNGTHASVGELTSPVRVLLIFQLHWDTINPRQHTDSAWRHPRSVSCDVQCHELCEATQDVALLSCICERLVWSLQNRPDPPRLMRYHTRTSRLRYPPTSNIVLLSPSEDARRFPFGASTLSAIPFALYCRQRLNTPTRL